MRAKKSNIFRDRTDLDKEDNSDSYTEIRRSRRTVGVRTIKILRMINILSNIFQRKCRSGTPIAPTNKWIYHCPHRAAEIFA